MNTLASSIQVNFNNSGIFSNHSIGRSLSARGAVLIKESYRSFSPGVWCHRIEVFPDLLEQRQPSFVIVSPLFIQNWANPPLSFAA